MLKRFRKYYFLFSSLLFLFGCNNDLALPQPYEGDVVFELTAEIDGESINLVAGQDNKFMHTNTTLDDNNIQLFQGILGDVGCQSCPNSLGFEFVQLSNSALLDDLLTAQSTILYRNNLIPMDTIGYNVIFEMTEVGTPPFTYEWDMGDNTTLIQNNRILQHQYTEAGIYNVCVNVTDATGCQSEICRTISTDNMMNCSIGYAVFNVDSTFANTFFFHTYSTGMPPFIYEWDTPVSLSSSMNFNVSSPIITVNQLNTMNVSVNMTDNHNCTCSVLQSVDFNNPDDLCINNFEYQSEPMFTPGIGQSYFSTITIQYVDENDVVYTSALGEQPSFANMNIIEATSFDNNSEGQSTKKINLEFECRLFDEDGNYIDLKNGKGTIAVAHL